MRLCQNLKKKQKSNGKCVPVQRNWYNVLVRVHLLLFIFCVCNISLFLCILIDRVVIIQLKGIPMVQDATQNVGQLGHVTTIGSGENTDSLRQPNHLQSNKKNSEFFWGYFLVIIHFIDDI